MVQRLHHLRAPACLALAERRDAARAVCDRSAETDANVLLRQHRRQEHQA
ncbi:hypothetical protein [Streptomyces incarnatus]|nr:hypothetical protein [Streptomyces incarnatus]